MLQHAESQGVTLGGYCRQNSILPLPVLTPCTGDFYYFTPKRERAELIERYKRFDEFDKTEAGHFEFFASIEDARKMLTASQGAIVRVRLNSATAGGDPNAVLNVMSRTPTQIHRVRPENVSPEMNFYLTILARKRSQTAAVTPDYVRGAHPTHLSEAISTLAVKAAEREILSILEIFGIRKSVPIPRYWTDKLVLRDPNPWIEGIWRNV